ncbi:MAG TPA: hypothetical protein VLF41_02950, partial [Candidatus Nanoarchaeia archaeon]|nr:hypothetical protein [Candidatus Nanoarchaeia archaeon]
TFKKIPGILKRHKDESYFSAGNWRDGDGAYKRIHPVIAPYDVNVVFYPQALKVMHRHAKLLLLDAKEIEQLIEKWARVKDWFRFNNPDGQPAYALALYDIRAEEDGVEYKKLMANHTDEAYEMFYGDPDEGDVVSFCQRLLDADYFYTPSGPTVVGANDGYPTTVYHGRVIWTKQTAFTVAGLERQLKLAKSKKWRSETAGLITEAIESMATASIKAWSELGAVPELHYDDNGVAKRYDEQPEADGPMNLVQLWSAIGARRIIRAYQEVARYAAK